MQVGDDIQVSHQHPCPQHCPGIHAACRAGSASQVLGCALRGPSGPLASLFCMGMTVSLCWGGASLSKACKGQCEAFIYDKSQHNFILNILF